MAEEKEVTRATILVKQELDTLAGVQTRLASSLVEWARSNDVYKAGDWVQGGWSRASDKIDIGWRVAGALQNKG